jgi:hypothetical protein
MDPSFKRQRTTYQLLWKEPRVSRRFRSGVSLHSHTLYSEESLDILPQHLGKIPFLGKALEASVDYNQAFWTPPLSPRQAYRLEEKQINRQFGLPGLVSLSDHDDLRAGSMLRVLPRFDKTPLSVEWTVPFGPTFFHVGVHNLPESEAASVLKMLHAFTSQPRCFEGLSFPVACIPRSASGLEPPALGREANRPRRTRTHSILPAEFGR